MTGCRRREAIKDARRAAWDLSPTRSIDVLETGQEIWSNDQLTGRSRDWPMVALDPFRSCFVTVTSGQHCRRRMAKQRRSAKTTAKPVRAASNGPATDGRVGSQRPLSGRGARASVSRPASPAAGRAAARPRSPPRPPPPRKPGFYEAVAIYERGVQALQRHDFRRRRRILPDGPRALSRGAGAARARAPVSAGLRARDDAAGRTARRPPSGSTRRRSRSTPAITTGALDHLQRARGEDPDSDHAHYIMAVALGMRERARRGASSICGAPSP